MSQPSPSILEAPDAPGVFVDALLTDAADGLLFLSGWGRDTAVQEFLARLSLSSREGGISELWVGRSEPVFVQGLQAERLSKLTGRTPAATIFGQLAHLWLYDSLACTPDPVNRRALMLYRRDEPHEDRLWRVVQATCHLPLLERWREPVLELARRGGWLRSHDGLKVNGIQVDLGGAEVEAAIGEAVRHGRLRLD